MTSWCLLPCQLYGNVWHVWDTFLQETVYSQYTSCGTVSFWSNIHWSRNQEMEIGVVPLIITPSYPLAKTLLSIPMILWSIGLEILVLERSLLLPENTLILLNWKLRLLSSYFVLLTPLSQQMKDGVTGVTDLDYQGTNCTIIPQWD